MCCYWIPLLWTFLEMSVRHNALPLAMKKTDQWTDNQTLVLLNTATMLVFVIRQMNQIWIIHYAFDFKAEDSHNNRNNGQWHITFCKVDFPSAIWKNNLTYFWQRNLYDAILNTAQKWLWSKKCLSNPFKWFCC